MKDVIKMSDAKVLLWSIAAAIGAALSRFFGSMDIALQTLLGFMAADYLTGIVIAAVYHKSPKSSGGTLSSAAGLKGLFKKGGMLLLVYVACRLDMVLGVDYIRDGCVFALLANETISLLENLGIMGVPLPDILKRAIDILKSKGEHNAEKSEIK